MTTKTYIEILTQAYHFVLQTKLSKTATNDQLKNNCYSSNLSKFTLNVVYIGWCQNLIKPAFNFVVGFIIAQLISITVSLNITIFKVTWTKIL